MSEEKLMEKVFIEVEVTGAAKDLVLFVKHLRQTGWVGPVASDDQLIRLAREFLADKRASKRNASGQKAKRR